MNLPITRKDASRTTQEISGGDEEQKSMGLDRLPNESLIEIVKYLPLNGLSQLSRVNREFNHIAYQQLRERSGVRPKVDAPKDGESNSLIEKSLLSTKLKDSYRKKQNFRDRINKIIPYKNKTPDNKNLHDLWSRATKIFKGDHFFQQFKDKVLSPETTRSYSYDYAKVLEILLKKPQDMTLQDLVAARLCTQEIIENIDLSDKKKSSIHEMLLGLPNLEQQIQLDDFLRISDQLLVKAEKIYKNDDLFQQFFEEIFSLKTQQDYNYDYGKVLEIWFREPQDIELQDLVDIGLCKQEIMESIKNKGLFSKLKKDFIRENLLNFFILKKRKFQLDDFLQIPEKILEKALMDHGNDPLFKKFLAEIYSPKTQQDYKYDYVKALEIWLRKPPVITPHDLVNIGLCTQKEREEMKLDEKFSDVKKYFIRENLLRLFIPKRKIQLKDFFEIPDKYIKGGIVETYARSKSLDHPVKHTTEQNPEEAQTVLQRMFNSSMFIHPIKYVYPMHWAAEKGELELLEKLIKHGWIMDQQNLSVRTALYIAAEYGKVEIVKSLIKGMSYSQLHSSIQQKDSCDNDALDCDLKWGEGKIAELLFRALKPGHQYQIMLKKNVLYRIDNLSYLRNKTVRRLFNALTLEHQYELLAQGEGIRGRPFLSEMVIDAPQIAKDLIEQITSSAQVYELLNRKDDDDVTTFGHAIQQENFELIQCSLNKLTPRAKQKLLAKKAAKGKTAMELAAKCKDERIFNYFKQISPPLSKRMVNYLKKVGSTLSKLPPIKQ